MKLTYVAFLAAAGALTFASGASAAVVCNDEGDCWRVREERTYEPSLKLKVYPDDWKWRDGDRYRWREPGRGHGYWRNGIWVEIK
jgi:hypothetical protein